MNNGCDSYQAHVSGSTDTLLLGCPHVLTHGTKKEETHNKFHVFKSYIRQCDTNAVTCAFRRLISLFKYSAEEEARICDGGG